MKKIEIIRALYNDLYDATESLELLEPEVSADVLYLVGAIAALKTDRIVTSNCETLKLLQSLPCWNSIEPFVIFED